MRSPGYIMRVILRGILPKGPGTGVGRILSWGFRRIALTGEDVWDSCQVPRLNFWIVAGADDSSGRASRSPGEMGQMAPSIPTAHT